MYLIDTSIWLDFLNNKDNTELVEQLQKLMQEKQVAWCPMIQLELQRFGKERESILSILEEVLHNFEISQAVWNLAYEIAEKCSRKGRPVPNSDVLIYATACHYGCKVFHNDKHFDWLANINLDNAD